MPHLFDMPCEEVDGRNVDEVFAAASRLIEHARRRKGPAFLHAVTERWAGSKPLWPELPTGETDIAMAWDDGRIGGEHADWYRSHDPILIYVRSLLADGVAGKDEIAALDREIDAQMAQARKFAVESPLPAAETALRHVFA
jgi:pyruvate dehydrogenase E1 component alpha subunit